MNQLNQFQHAMTDIFQIRPGIPLDFAESMLRCEAAVVELKEVILTKKE